MLFAVDVVYLDSTLRVIHLMESFGSFRVGPIRANCASGLELPGRTIYSSRTQLGDQLLICSASEMERFLREGQADAAFIAS